MSEKSDLLDQLRQAADPGVVVSTDYWTGRPSRMRIPLAGRAADEIELLRGMLSNLGDLAKKDHDDLLGKLAALRALLKQAIEFEKQTVRDYKQVRAWMREAMLAVGGYDVAAEEEREARHQYLIRGWKPQ